MQGAVAQRLLPCMTESLERALSLVSFRDESGWTPPFGPEDMRQFPWVDVGFLQAQGAMGSDVVVVIAPVGEDHL